MRSDSSNLRTCPACGEDIEHGFSACWSCGTELPEVVANQTEEAPAFIKTGAGPNTPEELFREAKVQKKSAEVLITTTASLPGFRVVKTLDVITSECAFGINALRDAFAKITDIVGGRSHSTQRVLREARKVCLQELREEAARLGGNAVVGVRLDYSDFSGHGKSMLFLVATGTAVVVKPQKRSEGVSDN